MSLFPDEDIAPSYCGQRGLAGPEGEGPGQGAADGLQGARWSCLLWVKVDSSLR